MRVTGTPGEPQKHRLSWWRRRSTSGWRWCRPLCDAQTNVLMEFEFTSRDGFPGTMERIPTIQVCMVYTVFSQSTNDDSNNDDGDSLPLTPQRKARICTYQVGAAFSGRDCQDKANLGVVMSYLTAKAHAIRKLTKKTSAARQFLTEWLANFMTKHHCNMETEKSSDCVVDTELESHARLRWLSRHVFGLLNSRGLARFASVHPDIQTSLFAQFSRIGSEHICKALYPQLMAFKDLNETSVARIPLSHLAMIKRYVQVSACLVDSLTCCLAATDVLNLNFWYIAVREYSSSMRTLQSLSCTRVAKTRRRSCRSRHRTRVSACSASSIHHYPGRNLTCPRCVFVAHIRQEFERRIRDRQLVPRCAIICVSDNQHELHVPLDLRFFNALLLDECGHAGEDYTSFAQNLRTAARQQLVSASSSGGIVSSYRRLSLLQD